MYKTLKYFYKSTRFQVVKSKNNWKGCNDLPFEKYLHGINAVRMPSNELLFYRLLSDGRSAVPDKQSLLKFC
jgi:hypothetical protein